MGTSTEIEKILHAQKPHLCSWCAEKIPPGAPYSRYRWYDGGDASTVKLHPECLAALNEAKDIDEFSPGENPRGCWCFFECDCGRYQKARSL